MAATGTPTPNLGLRIPQGTDPASVDDINYNSNLLDTKIGAVGNDSVQDQIDSLNSNIANLNSSSHLSGSSTYLTSYDIYYTKLGKVCTFVCQFVPNTTISSSIGTIDNIGLPKPKHNYVCVYPVVEQKEGWVSSDVQGRFGSFRGTSSLSSAQMKASGSFSAGTTYSFAGSYVTEN